MSIPFFQLKAPLSARSHVLHGSRAWLAGAVLLGEGRVGDLGKRFQTGDAQIDSWQWVALILVLLAVIAAVCLIARYVNRRDQTTCYSPQRLFRELCAAHHLSRPERKLLWSVAEQLELEHPAILFVDPLRLETRQLGESFRSVEDELAALRQRIFHHHDVVA